MSNANRIWIAALFCLAIFLPTTLTAQAPSLSDTGKVRTYYVAADEVSWDYAPASRDEAMGMPFDEIAKLYTEPAAHRIGRVYKKAV